ncbi:MAG TPA: hypothetical protein VLI54_01540 [Bacillota bacterium]|nr:hypothetical protein [Bacillota bacterium]
MPPELRPGHFEFNAPGFDGVAYHVGVTASRLTLQPRGGESAIMPGLEPDQHAILRFIAEHVGTGFRAADVYSYFDSPDEVRRRFNEAAYDETSGLYSFVKKTTGEGNLWFRDGKDNQFGAGSQAAAQNKATAQRGIVEHLAVRGEFDFTNDEAKLMDVLAAIQPDERTPADQLFALVAERLGQSPQLVERTFRAVTSKTTARARGVAVMGVSARGKGRNLRRTAWVSPLLFAPPAAVTAPAVIPTEIVAPATSIASATASTGEATSLSIPNPSLHHEQIGLVDTPPEVAWHLDPDEGLVINGRSLPLQSLAVRFLVELRDTCVANPDKHFALAGFYKKISADWGSRDPFIKFLQWASSVCDVANLYAPVVIIDNSKQPTEMRGRETGYRFNTEGTWTPLRAVPAGISSKNVDWRRKITRVML